jgi:hypothetical protein
LKNSLTLRIDFDRAGQYGRNRHLFGTGGISVKSRLTSRFWAALSLVALAAGVRLLPHPANVTPIVAMALFSGAVFSRKSWSVAVPLLAMFVSDLALGIHDQMVSVYGSLVLISFLGFALAAKRSAGRVALASVASSVLFFVITNFTVWLTGEFYPKTISGLAECYTLALPFFRNGVIGDLAFSGLLFGAWAFIAGALPAADRSQKGTI